jgi:hypothetical protein
MRVSSHPWMTSGWRARLEGANSTEVQRSQRRATGGQWVTDSAEARPVGSGLGLKGADSAKPVRDRGEAGRKEWIRRREREKKKKPLEENGIARSPTIGVPQVSLFRFYFVVKSETVKRAEILTAYNLIHPAQRPKPRSKKWSTRPTGPALPAFFARTPPPALPTGKPRPRSAMDEDATMGDARDAETFVTRLHIRTPF